MRVVSAMIAGLAVLGTAAVARADTTACAPAARVEGDPTLAAAVEGELDAIGIGRPGAGCPAVRVSVSRSTGGLEIELHSEGRTARRELTGPAIAATWIESWAREDLRAPLLAARTAPAPVIGAVPSTPTSAPPPTDGEPSPDDDELRLPVSVALGLTDLDADDDSSWRALDLDVSTRWGSTVVGATARLGRNHGFSKPELLTRFDRDLADLLVGVGVPFRVGRVHLTWSVGAGVGVVWTRREPPPNIPPDPNTCPDPSDPCCAPDMAECPPLPELDDSALGISARVSTSLTASVPLSGWLFLDLEGGLDVMPGAHAEPYESQAMPNDPLFALPGEPERFFHLGLGLRIGAP